MDSAYNTGDRVIALGELTGRVGEHDYTVAAYNVFRAPGNYASGDRAGRENIANLFLSLGVHTLGTILEPSLELRHWLQNVYDAGTPSPPRARRAAGSRPSDCAHGSMRAGSSFSERHGYTAFGRLAMTDAAGLPVQASLSGFHLGLVVRASR